MPQVHHQQVRATGPHTAAYNPAASSQLGPNLTDE